MKYLGGIFFLFLVWIMIFLVLAAGEEPADSSVDAEIPAYSYPAAESFPISDDQPSDILNISDDDGIREGLIYNYAPERDVDGDILITVSDEAGNVSLFKLEEYLAGTVFAEMPSKFEPEALKAQAVAARSYCYYKMAHRSSSESKPSGESAEGHPAADVCNDYSHCKAYTSYEYACEKYGEPYTVEAFAKIRAAISETKGEILVYQNEPALAVFHSMSASFTESAANVWGGDVPYLVSAPTPEDFYTENVSSSVILSTSEILTGLAFAGYPCDADSPVPSINFNDSGRVGFVNIFGVSISGVEFRRIFSLRSADFSIAFDAALNQYAISVYGVGHGVGMSQYGANLLALDGFSYRDILLRYYSGVEVFALD